MHQCKHLGIFAVGTIHEYIIEVLSQFVDMSDKCYPIKIEGVEEQYYVIYNLKTYPFWNKDDVVSAYDDPEYFGIHDKSIPIFGIDDTAYIIVSEEIKTHF